MNSNDLINDFFSKLYSGNINEFNKFIENNNLPVNIKNNNNENALHVIIKSDLSDILKINFIKYLYSKNININDKDCNGNSPFNLACQKQLFNIMIVLYNLYKNEINLYDKNNYNINPIYYILKGEIVDELEDYPSPEKFIKNESILKINDLSKLNDEIKSFVKNKNIFNNDKLIKIIKENAKFELETNKLLIDEKIDQFKNKIIENKNNLSSDFKSQFNNEILNILKKSHPKIFEPINFESTKSFDNDGFYYLKNDEKTNYKIHGEPTFNENLEIIKKNNEIEIKNYNNKYKEIINSLDPISFHFDFLENIAHVYYCSEFSKNIKKLLNGIKSKNCKNISSNSHPKNVISSFIEFINNQAKPEEAEKSDKYIIGNNKLFNNFIIQIDDLHKACKSSEFIYIKNIVTNQEIFIYKNNDDKGIKLYQSRTFIGGNIDNDRRLALEIEVKDSLLELKLNNKSLGIGQFKIEFYEYNGNPNEFKFIDKIDIKTNEYNESIKDFFTEKIKLQKGSGNNQNYYEFFDKFLVPGEVDEPDDIEDEIYDIKHFSTVEELDDNDKLDKDINDFSYSKDNDEKKDMKIDNDDRDIKIDNDKLDKDIYDFLYSNDNDEKEDMKIDNDDRDIKIDKDDRDIYEYLSNNKNKILIFYGNNIDQNSNESKIFDLTNLLSKQIKDKIQENSINNFKQEFIYEGKKISFYKFIFDENINNENNKNRKEEKKIRREEERKRRREEEKKRRREEGEEGEEGEERKEEEEEEYINLNFADSLEGREEDKLKQIIIDYDDNEQYYPDELYGEANDIEKNKYFLKKTILDHINQNIKEIKLRDGENTFLYKSKNSKSYIDEKDTIILFSVYTSNYDRFPTFLLHKFDLNTLGLNKNIKYIDNFNQFMVDDEGNKIHYIDLSDKLNIPLKYEIYLNYINKIKKQKKNLSGFNEINELNNILKESRINDEYDINLIIQNLSDKNDDLLNEINNRKFIINDLSNQLNAIKNKFLYDNNIFSNFLKDIVRFYKNIFENNDFENNLIINKNIFDITNNFDIILFVKNSNQLGGSWRNKSTSSNNPTYPPNRYSNRRTRPTYARKNYPRSNINPNLTENYYKGYNRNIPFNNINQITIPYKNRNYYDLFTYIIEEEDKNFFNNEIEDIDSFRQLFYFKNEDKPKTFFDIFYKENKNFQEKMINKLKKLEEITDKNTTFGELFILVDIGTYSHDPIKKINCDYCTALANINLNNFKKLYQKNIKNDYFLNFLNYFLNKDNIKNLSYYLEDSTELYFEYLDYIKKIDISSNNFNSNEKKKEIVIFTKQWDQYFIHKININSNYISKIDNYNQIIELEDRNVSTEENISTKENSKNFIKKKFKDFINENLLDLYIQDIIINDTINDGIQYLTNLKQNDKIIENIENLLIINNQERYTKFYTLNLRKRNNAIKNIYNKIKDKFNNIIFVEDKIDDQLDAIIYILIEKAKFYKFEINDDFKENLKIIIENFSEEDKNILIEALTYNKDDYEEYIIDKFQLEKTQQSDIKLQIGGEIEIDSIIEKINNDNYIDKLIDKPEKLDKIINIQLDLDQKYFDKSKFNFNYLQKLYDEKERYKLELANAIDQYKLIIITELNKTFLDTFDSNKIPTKESNNLKDAINKFKEKTENLKNNVDKDELKDFEKKLKSFKVELNKKNPTTKKSIIDNIKNYNQNSYLISLAYRDFYFYFRYYILEQIITDNFMGTNKDIPDKINVELNKIFKYYNFKTKNDNGVEAAKLAIIGDILDNILINKVKNVIFNEINLYISKENEFEIKEFKNTLSPDLIDIDNEFDVDLSKMNEKIKNILKVENIYNKLVYNLGNVLINNVKVQPILYYTNNFFDININKQQFIIYNKELKELLKDKIVLNYDLTKSLIDNQNKELLEALNEKIKLDENKITKLIEYIQENKINNNIYKYQDFCDNYNYHLKEELKKIQNHKNIFKYYDYLISVFIYFYKSTKKEKTNLDDGKNVDLEESLDIEELKKSVNNSSDNNIKNIKQYSKTNIIKCINEKFKKNFENIEFNDGNLNNLEMMLVNPKDINNNEQLKKEFTSICLAIDLVVGNMYSKLLKRFLLEYFTDKYSSDVSKEESLNRIKNIINNIMVNIDNLINTKYKFKISDFNDISIDEITEFTKKLVILHSEGRYQIKEYVELDEDNLFNEIVNLIKSNSYEKIEDDDIILTYLKDNINDYFKKFYKIAINTLIACSSGINNYILYHNKYKIILDFLNHILKSNNKPTKAKKIQNELDSFFDFTS